MTSRKWKWLETETDITKNELPAAVQSALKSQFADYTLEEAARVEKADGQMVYEAEMERGEETLEVMLQPDGKVVSQQTEQEEDDDQN